MIVYGSDQFVAKWVQQRLPAVPTGFGPCSAIGFARDGRLIGGVVYHDYRPAYGTIQLSAAADDRRWLSEKNLQAIFAYPFDQLKCNCVYIAVSRKNKHARKFVEKVGFKYSGLLRRGFGFVDAALYDMLPNECRWRVKSERQPLAALNSAVS